MNRLTRNILLIPGPLTTSNMVKKISMLDYSARETFIIDKIKSVRQNLLNISNLSNKKWTSILFQGSGTYANESVISCLPSSSKIDIMSNGIYGDRLADISNKYKYLNNFIKLDNKIQITGDLVENQIKESSATHLSIVHNETTTGIENNLKEICQIAKKYNKKIILDAISSYGGIPFNIDKLDIDYVIGSSNKCLHGYPGLGFVITKKDLIEESKNNSKTLSLDLYEQYQDFEKEEQFRFTPPVQVINSLDVSIKELIDQGGIEARNLKYKKLNSIVNKELTQMGFKSYIPKNICSPILSTFYIPNYVKEFDFNNYSEVLRKHNIVLYPSPINNNRVIRVGNIGDITIDEMYQALGIMKILINQR